MINLNKTIIIYFSGFSYNFPYNWTKQNAFELAKKTTVIYEYSRKPKINLWAVINYLLKSKNSHKHNKPLEFYSVSSISSLKITRFLYYFQLWCWVIFYKSLNRKKEIVLWFSYPTDEFDFIQKFFRKAVIIYDYTDHFVSLEPEAGKKLVHQQEAKIISKADYIFANSPVLYQYLCRIYHQSKQKIYLVPAGYVLSNYLNVSYQLAKQMQQIKKPIVGMIGSISDRIDFDLFSKIIKLNPDLAFVFLGEEYRSDKHYIFTQENVKKKLSSLKRFKNYYEFLNIPFDELGSFITAFDVALVLYRKDILFNQYSNPIKIYIYFALGKPVVSTTLPIAIHFKKYLKLADQAKKFSDQIRSSLNSKKKISLEKSKYKLAVDNDISKKISSIQKILSVS